MRAHRIKTLQVSELNLIMLFLLLLCAPMLDYAFGGLFSFVDELSCLIICAWAFLRACENKLGTHEKRSIAYMVIICILGCFGNLLYGFQTNIFGVAVDLFTCIKLFICYLSARVVLKDRRNCLSAFQTISKIFLSFAFLGLILHVTGIVNMGSGRMMFGVPCYQFFFSHPTNLAAYCVGCAALLFVDTTPSRGWIVLSCILLIATQRAKAIAMAFVIIFLLFYNVAKRGDQAPSRWVFVLLGIGSAILAMDQIQEYFLTSTSARSLLMQAGVDIAFNCFPFGSGFASFATYMSGAYYSPLYYEYGLNSVWGLMPANPSFVSDSFWPAVIAQFGFFGTLLLILLLGELFKSISSDAKGKGVRFAAYGIIPIYLLILSTADASFFNFYGPYYALVVAAIVNLPSEQGASVLSA